MSNKSQLQTNNTKVASLIETLKNKAASSGGEDVTEETNAYTTKLSSLENAVTALETELAGKASGGSGTETCTVMITKDFSQSFGVVMYCALENNKMTIKVLAPTSSAILLENVVCNSAINILVNYLYSFPELSYSADATDYILHSGRSVNNSSDYQYVIVAPSTPNSQEIIHFIDED